MIYQKTGIHVVRIQARHNPGLGGGLFFPLWTYLIISLVNVGLFTGYEEEHPHNRTRESGNILSFQNEITTLESN